jgi:hypothetical protein
MFWKERKGHIVGLSYCRKEKKLNMPYNAKIGMEKKIGNEKESSVVDLTKTMYQIKH